MTAILLIACISAPIAAIVGFFVGHKIGCKVGEDIGYGNGLSDGFRGGRAITIDDLILTLDRPQSWNGVGVLYLLRRMRGEKV